jgi:protein tyrosine/serine phosphatase
MMLVMLCQSILGVSDEEIVEDYFKSDSMRESSASDIVKPRRKGKLDRNVFAGSPREAMLQTLDYIRTKYGSVSPAYVDSIGFDQAWRERLQKAASLLPSKL